MMMAGKIFVDRMVSYTKIHADFIEEVSENSYAEILTHPNHSMDMQGKTKKGFTGCQSYLDVLD